MSVKSRSSDGRSSASSWVLTEDELEVKGGRRPQKKILDDDSEESVVIPKRKFVQRSDSSDRGMETTWACFWR